MTDITDTRPNRLRELREARGEPVEQVALDMGLGKETIMRWERGRKPIPTQYLHTLADRYGVTISWLLRDERETAA